MCHLCDSKARKAREEGSSCKKHRTKKNPQKGGKGKNNSFLGENGSKVIVVRLVLDNLVRVNLLGLNSSPGASRRGRKRPASWAVLREGPPRDTSTTPTPAPDPCRSPRRSIQPIWRPWKVRRVSSMAEGGRRGEEAPLMSLPFSPF